MVRARRAPRPRVRPRGHPARGAGDGGPADETGADLTPHASHGDRTPEALAGAWREALLRRDAAAFGALFAEDAVMVDVEHRTADGRAARPLVGRADIEETAARWCATTAPFRFDYLETLADAERVAVRWRYAVGDGPALDGVSWLRCQHGRIVHALVLFDVGALDADDGR